MGRLRRCAAMCIGLALAIPVRGGELRLSNGAVIPGELAKVEAMHLVWKAELLGDLRVPKSAVLHVDSATRLALQANAGSVPLRDCQLAVAAANASLACADAPALSTPLALLREAPPDRADDGKVTVEVALERGSNATEDDFDVDARRTRRNGNRRHNFLGSMDYEQNRGRTTQDEAELEYQADFLRPNSWYLYALTEYRRDREGSIQESLLLGAGLGREFHPYEDVFFRLQTGLGEADLSIDERGKEVVEVGMLRWRGNWKTPWWDAQVVHEGNYGFALENTEINLLETKTGVEIPIGNSLLAEFRLEYDHYGITPAGEPKDDIEWVFGLGFRW